MMERLDAIGFVMMNCLCRNCFQFAKYSLSRNKKKAHRRIRWAWNLGAEKD